VSERSYIFLVGVIIVLGLYLESAYIIFGLSGILVFEGLSNIRLPVLVRKLAHKPPPTVDMHAPNTHNRYGLSAVRAWHMMVGTTLAASYYLAFVMGYSQMWFLSWVIGVAALGAGVTSSCPLYAALVWMGFKHPVSG
jgi:hypothetical protein